MRLTSLAPAALAALAIVLLPSTAAAQQEVHAYSDAGDLGWSAESIGDVDGDAFGDYVLGDPYYSGIAGRAVVVSGRTGTMVREHLGATANGEFGDAVAGVGDVDLDGVPDYAVGEPGAGGVGNTHGFVTVFSGATGAIVWGSAGNMSSRLGDSIAAAGDLDGDGRGDVLAVAKDKEYVLFDGFGNVAWSLPSSFAYSVGGLGDLDGDGLPDLAFGEPAWTTPTAAGCGQVHAYSGATKQLLWTLEGTFLLEMLGETVDGIGDVDFDGVPDVLAGGSAGLNAPGEVAFISGVDGHLLRIKRGTKGSRVGIALAGMPDIDGDGVDDCVAGGRSANKFAGTAAWLSGSDGHLLWKFEPVTGEVGLGWSVAGGDFDGDGRGDSVIAAASVGGGQPSVIRLLRGCPATSRNYGAGWPGTLGTPSLAPLGVPGLGTTFDADLQNTLGATTLALLFVGSSSATIPLRGGATLLLLPDSSISFSLPMPNLVLSADIPDDPALCDVLVFAQAFEFDAGAAGGLSATEGLELRLGYALN